MENRDLKKFILWWNQTFPIDIIWRRKYNIAFNSSKHRAMSLVDIKMELIEDKMIDYSQRLNHYKKEEKEYYKETGEWLREAEDKLSEEEAKKIFDDIDITKLNG